jgi:hypothetical protein
MRIAWGFAAEEKDAVFPKPFRIDIHPPGWLQSLDPNQALESNFMNIPAICLMDPSNR